MDLKNIDIGIYSKIVSYLPTNKDIDNFCNSNDYFKRLSERSEFWSEMVKQLSLEYYIENTQGIKYDWKNIYLGLLWFDNMKRFIKLKCDSLNPHPQQSEIFTLKVPELSKLPITLIPTELILPPTQVPSFSTDLLDSISMFSGIVSSPSSYSSQIHNYMEYKNSITQNMHDHLIRKCPVTFKYLFSNGLIKLDESYLVSQLYQLSSYNDIFSFILDNINLDATFLLYLISHYMLGNDDFSQDNVITVLQYNKTNSIGELVKVNMEEFAEFLYDNSGSGMTILPNIFKMYIGLISETNYITTHRNKNAIRDIILDDIETLMYETKLILDPSTYKFYFDHLYDIIPDGIVNPNYAYNMIEFLCMSDYPITSISDYVFSKLPNELSVPKLFKILRFFIDTHYATPTPTEEVISKFWEKYKQELLPYIEDINELIIEELRILYLNLNSDTDDDGNGYSQISKSLRRRGLFDSTMKKRAFDSMSKEIDTLSKFFI